MLQRMSLRWYPMCTSPPTTLHHIFLQQQTISLITALHREHEDPVRHPSHSGRRQDAAKWLVRTHLVDPAVGLPVSWIQALCITTPRDRTAATSPADACAMPGCTASSAAPAQARGDVHVSMETDRCASVSTCCAGDMAGCRPHAERSGAWKRTIGTRHRRTPPIGWVQQVSPLGGAASGASACAGAAGPVAGAVSELTLPAPQAKNLCRC